MSHALGGVDPRLASCTDRTHRWSWYAPERTPGPSRRRLDCRCPFNRLSIASPKVGLAIGGISGLETTPSFFKADPNFTAVSIV